MLSKWKSIFQKDFIISLKYFSSGSSNFSNLFRPELEQSLRNVNTPSGALVFLLSKFLRMESRLIWQSFPIQQNSLNSTLSRSPTES